MQTSQTRMYEPSYTKLLNVKLLTELSSYARIVQALTRLQVLPERLRNVFFGDISGRISSVRAERQMRRRPSHMSRRAEIDSSCALYLENIYTAHIIHFDQLDELQNVTANGGLCAGFIQHGDDPWPAWDRKDGLYPQFTWSLTEPQ